MPNLDSYLKRLSVIEMKEFQKIVNEDGSESAYLVLDLIKYFSEIYALTEEPLTYLNYAYDHLNLRLQDSIARREKPTVRNLRAQIRFLEYARKSSKWPSEVVGKAMRLHEENLNAYLLELATQVYLSESA